MPSRERATARELDEDGKSRLVPSANERIRVPQLWALEFYSPRYLKKLMESFRRFGWHGTGGMFERPDASEWLSNAREREHGWWNVGRLGDVPRLPAGVQYADGHLGVVSSGLAAFVVCFTYEDEHSGEVEDCCCNGESSGLRGF